MKYNKPNLIIIIFSNERGVSKLSGHIHRLYLGVLLIVVIFALATSLCLAESSTPATAAPPALATAAAAPEQTASATEQAATPGQPADQTLPAQWDELGRLLMTIVDQQVEGSINTEMDAFVKELRDLLLAHDQQLGDLDKKITVAMDKTNQDMTALKAQLASLQQEVTKSRTTSEQQVQQISQLQAENNSLNKRFWIAAGVAALGLILSIVK